MRFENSFYLYAKKRSDDLIQNHDTRQGIQKPVVCSKIQKRKNWNLYQIIA